MRWEQGPVVQPKLDPWMGGRAAGGHINVLIQFRGDGTGTRDRDRDRDGDRDRDRDKDRDREVVVAAGNLSVFPLGTIGLISGAWEPLGCRGLDVCC